MEQKRIPSADTTPEFWRDHINNWRESGVSLSEYSRRQNLSYHRCIYWKRKFSNRPPVSPIVELKITDRSTFPPIEACNRPALRLFIDSRYRLEIEAGFDPAALTEVIRVLEAV